jgi:hypothetical protein
MYILNKVYNVAHKTIVIGLMGLSGLSVYGIWCQLSHLKVQKQLLLADPPVNTK